MPLNLRTVDLNLLVVLDALLAERSVSRAGMRIGLSQSATSAALSRLREVFRDPILVRSGRGLALTRNAEELIVPVRDILGRIEHALEDRPQFDPQTDSRTFSISASDYATLVLLAPLVRAMAAEAPGISIHILPRYRDVARVLQTNQADIVVEPRELFADTRFDSQSLFSDRWLCAVDRANPDVRGDRLTLKRYQNLPHLAYSIGPDRQLNLADQHLVNTGVRRRMEITVESFLLVPFLLQGTRLVSVILERAARQLIPSAPVRILKPPVELPDIHEAMFWHPRHRSDPGHRWLRERLAAVAAQLQER
jgi:DNA-binding transcriptional LysR family regulator